MPPSTNSMSPVMKLDSSLARNTAALATSPGVPRRPIGTRARRRSHASSVTTRLAPSVGVGPGAIALTRILRGPNSAAAERVDAGDRRLHAAVHDAVAHREHRGRRGDVDDRAAARLRHVVEHRLIAPDHALEADVDHPADHVFGLILQRSVAIPHRVVDEDGHGPEGRAQSIDRREHVVAPGNVADERKRLAALGLRSPGRPDRRPPASGRARRPTRPRVRTPRRSHGRCRAHLRSRAQRAPAAAPSLSPPSSVIVQPVFAAFANVARDAIGMAPPRVGSA